MSQSEKALWWFCESVKTPPFSRDARIEAGFLLRRLQLRETLALPQSRPMPQIGPGCHELRINDHGRAWRIFYYIASDAVVILDLFEKKTRQTPQYEIDLCKQRLRNYRSG